LKDDAEFQSSMMMISLFYFFMTKVKSGHDFGLMRFDQSGETQIKKTVDVGTKIFKTETIKTTKKVVIENVRGRKD
jgi:hypothetical protein